MELKVYNNKKEFCEENLKLLEKEEAINNIMIGAILLATEENIKDWFLARVENNAQIQMIVVVNTPRNGLLMYSPTNNCSDELCKFIALKIFELKIELFEINSRKEICEKVAKYYSEATGKGIKCKKDKYILSLEKLDESIELSQKEELNMMKVDDDEHLNEICSNIKEFQEDAHGEVIEYEDSRRYAKIFREKGLYIFKNKNGEIVLQAMTGRKLRNGYVIGAVVTPRIHRGKGYAKIGIYMLTKKLLKDGAKVLAMYTNAKNEVSNHVYEKIGYKRISEELLIEFK